jgi:hypothetical protein
VERRLRDTASAERHALACAPRSLEPGGGCGPTPCAAASAAPTLPTWDCMAGRLGAACVLVSPDSPASAVAGSSPALPSWSMAKGENCFMLELRVSEEMQSRLPLALLEPGPDDAETNGSQKGKAGKRSWSSACRMALELLCSSDSDTLPALRRSSGSSCTMDTACE